MTKILYIEDNIDASLIIKLFRKLLNKDLRDKITNAKNQEEILEIVSKSNNLDICTNFIKSINIINKINENDYDLIILDRDLYSVLDKNNSKKLGNYNKDLLPDDFDEELFFLREGDYLITILHKKININKQLYFLSGNTDDIREKPQFKYLLSEEFKKNNIFYKTTEDYNRLRKVIDNNLCVKYENYDICGKNNEIKSYVEVLDRYIGKDAVNKFIDLKKYKADSSQIEGNLVRLRKLLQFYIIKEIVKGITCELELKIKDQKGNEKIHTAFYPKDKKYDTNITYEANKYNQINKNKLMIENEVNIGNSIAYICKIFNMLKSKKTTDLMLTYPWKILSELIHDDKLTEYGENFIQDTDRAINTVNILYYQLKEIILWFREVMENIDKS